MSAEHSARNNKTQVFSLFFFHRFLKSQAKVKEITRDLRNKTEEAEEYKTKLDSLKNEKRRNEKIVFDVSMKQTSSLCKKNKKISRIKCFINL